MAIMASDIIGSSDNSLSCSERHQTDDDWPQQLDKGRINPGAVTAGDRVTQPIQSVLCLNAQTAYVPDSLTDTGMCDGLSGV